MYAKSVHADLLSRWRTVPYRGGRTVGKGRAELSDFFIVVLFWTAGQRGCAAVYFSESPNLTITDAF